MKYFARLGEHEFTVEVSGEGPRYRVSFRGTDLEAELDRDGTLRLGRSCLPVTVLSRAGSILEFVAEGRRFSASVESEVDRVLESSHQDRGHGSAVLESVMPGIVTRILVSAGDEVKAGQPLLLLEAMKMENEVRAQRSGRVEALHVKPGDTVESGVSLVTIADPG